MKEVTIKYTSPFTKYELSRIYWLPLEAEAFERKRLELMDRKIPFTVEEK